MVRYCAPELLDVEGIARNEKRKPTNKSDVYSLPMVIVEVRLSFRIVTSLGSDCFRIQLGTGKIPFHGFTDQNVTVLILRGKRPSKPHRFEAPGMTPAVWKIAEKCWREKAKERPEVKVVLQDLENIVNTGRCTHSECICLPRELIDPQSEANGNLPRSGNCGAECFLTEYHLSQRKASLPPNPSVEMYAMYLVVTDVF